jgi:hypothetical protein
MVRPSAICARFQPNSLLSGWMKRPSEAGANEEKDIPTIAANTTVQCARHSAAAAPIFFTSLTLFDLRSSGQSTSLISAKLQLTEMPR